MGVVKGAGSGRETGLNECGGFGGRSGRSEERKSRVERSVWKKVESGV